MKPRYRPRVRLGRALLGAFCLMAVLALSGCRAAAPEGGVWEDAFDDGAGWQLSSDAVADVALRDGTLVVRVFQPQQVAWATSERQWGDLHVTVEATHVSGPDDNEYGVLVRMNQSKSFYAFSISGDGYARIARYENGVWTVLGPDWVPSDAIAQGAATNVLEVRAQGASLEFIVNGQPVLQAEDAAFKTGSIGLYAGAFAEGDVVVAFDNLQVSPLP